MTDRNKPRAAAEPEPKPDPAIQPGADALPDAGNATADEVTLVHDAPEPVEFPETVDLLADAPKNAVLLVIRDPFTSSFLYEGGHDTDEVLVTQRPVAVRNKTLADAVVQSGADNGVTIERVGD